MDRPKVGVGVFVLRGNRILVGKRIGAHGAGSWSLPGGHLEAGERIEDCAAREVLEEAGLCIADVRQGPYTNDIFLSEGMHYVTLFVLSAWTAGEPAS